MSKANKYLVYHDILLDMALHICDKCGATKKVYDSGIT